MPPTARTAAAWLATAAPDPRAFLRTWERTGRRPAPPRPAPLPAGRQWDAVLTPAPFGRAALDSLARLPGPGPALQDRTAATVAFLVPTGTAAGLLGSGIRTLGHGTALTVPHPDGTDPALHWLIPRTAPADSSTPADWNSPSTTPPPASPASREPGPAHARDRDRPRPAHPRTAIPRPNRARLDP
ncbi:hypothetical protein BX265_2283 [Streptomyces sp. TLI_235]|nr:hypothetical protein [Streptomyces sp. TLI_235]PBC77532.1 hypothetical protein BX265_2283 [Streptomyces sp. TLI_235]